MENPLVTIIIPAYNYQLFLPDTLTSVLGQKYQNFELIVVDDGSTDKTKDVVAEFTARDSRIKYFYQSNAGLSAARNLGIKNSMGKYIQFLDADDLLSDLKLSLQIEDMEKDATIDISYTMAYYFVDGSKEKLYKNIALNQDDWMPKLNASGYDILEMLVKQNIMPVNSALIKSSSLRKIGFFDMAMKSLEDWDFWISCAFKDFHFAFLPAEGAFALIRVHKSSMSQNRKKMSGYEIIVRKRIKNLIKNCSFINSGQKRLLEKSNARHNKVILSGLIKESQLSLKECLRLIKNAGLFQFVASYLKVMNDSRKS
ncbi:glycosyltransferase family A protein [Pedobacter sp. PF22-3]|uniref:glycosyltransferase family 2 protein n=1 Tax=Pedobacter sp. PF22-3 TaxID=2994467 RepID=UPI002245DB25|nr:glycosyltransferase family A protein [Pedobacter sp. PF22-3]MCX2495842.1 glycosyltransferase family A protein [Pedobacter sp. PF22-3]